MCLKTHTNTKHLVKKKVLQLCFTLRSATCTKKKNTKGNLVLQVLEMLFKAVSEKF